MTQQTLVSVLMPVFNDAATLPIAVASVRAQSHEAWELLLVDDGSTDGTGAVAARLAAEDPRIRVLSMPANGGAAAARNMGLAHSRGRYIALLDADDSWHPDKLTRQLAFMAATGAKLSFTGYSRVSPEGARIERVHVPDSVDYQTLLGRNIMGALTVIYDAEALGRVPMPDLPRQHDFALWLRLTRLHGPAYGLDEDLATYLVRPGSLSGNKRRAACDAWRVYRQCEGLALLPALRHFASYTYYGLRYRLFQRPKYAPDPSGSIDADHPE
ncbi:glycosyltransferase family 2 protein [Rhodobacteraceae bacterium KMM 6894]|nr:glycosyltransferase family 2 protein [Rhodobacteraceae bacterium KMM 6894]